MGVRGDRCRGSDAECSGAGIEGAERSGVRPSEGERAADMYAVDRPSTSLMNDSMAVAAHTDSRSS